MKILHAFSSFDPGGQESRFANIVADLGDDLSHIIVAMDGRYGAASQISAKNVTYLKLDARKGPGAPNFKQFREILRAVRPSHLVTYNFGALEWVFSTAQLKIMHTHVEEGFTSDETKKRKLSRNLLRAITLNLFSSKLVVVSESMRTIARKEWFLRENQIRIIPNGVDSELYVPRVKSSHSTFQSKPGQIVIGTAARLRPEKRLDRLLEAFAQLVEKSQVHNPELRLVIAGDGPEKNALIELAQKLKISDSVEFIGYRTDLNQVFSNFDIFCLTSDTEQMPFSLIEAMACGLPCVCTNVGDVSAIASEENQEFITNRAATDLSFKLRILCDDEKLRAKIGLANRKRAQAKFSKALMVQEWRSCYARI